MIEPSTLASGAECRICGNPLADRGAIWVSMPDGSLRGPFCTGGKGPLCADTALAQLKQAQA